MIAQTPIRRTGTPILFAWMAIATLGCGGEEGNGDDIPLLDVHVSGNSPDPITFSWEGTVSELDVRACGEPCDDLCYKGNVVSGIGQWYRGSAFDFEANIGSPVVYGMVGNTPDPNAKPLTAGVLHAVAISRNGPCDPPEAGCAQALAVGCTVFTP